MTSRYEKLMESNNKALEMRTACSFKSSDEKDGHHVFCSISEQGRFYFHASVGCSKDQAVEIANWILDMTEPE